MRTGLDNPKDKAFRADYNQAYKMAPDVYAVQGYDAAQMLDAGLSAVKALADPSPGCKT